MRTYCIDCKHGAFDTEEDRERYENCCPAGVLRAFNKMKHDCPKFIKKNV